MTSPPSAGDDRRVDDLRQQLRSLGYLDAGVDRFVLAPAVRSRRPTIIALLASVRSGIVAAVLLGPAAAIGLAARLPGLVTGVRDAIVIAIYMAVLFGAAVTLLSFVAALAVSLVARSAPHRARRLSTAAGIGVTMACLAYLTLWWRTANAGFGWQAPVWTAFALVVAVAISLLVGHVVTLTARAVAVSRSVGDTQQPRVPGIPWKLAVAVGAVAFAGAAALLVLTAERPYAGSDVPLAVRSTGARVLVIAVDGFDPNLYRQWVGRIRPFPLVDSDTRTSVALLEPADSRDPARLWTTIATGRSPEAHGVEQLETRRVAGLQGRLTTAPLMRVLAGATDLLRLTEPAIASNVERKTKTFWEVAAQAGLRTSVTNWWATWPAEPAAGTVLSDRAILRLERGGTLDAEIAPAAAYDALKGKWGDLRRAAVQEAASYFGRPSQRDAPMSPSDTRSILIRSAELDAMVARVAEESAGDVDLGVLYLPGLDIAQHTLFASEPPSPSEMVQRVGALRQYYDYLSSLVSGTISRRPRVEVLFVIAQAGRLHESDGVFAAGGFLFRPAQSKATVLDIAPTILHALGVPVARDLEGRVIEALFAEQALAMHPVRFIETYGRRGNTARARAGQPLDAEAIERLRSLGYIR